MNDTAYIYDSNFDEKWEPLFKLDDSSSFHLSTYIIGNSILSNREFFSAQALLAFSATYSPFIMGTLPFSY